MSNYQEREKKAVDAIKNVIPSSLKRNLVRESSGFFSELYENKELFPEYYCATAIDGVGTKVIIAEAMEKYDTIGIDCVAMNANDLCCYGQVSPFLFLDYLACQNKIQEKAITGDIIKGIVKGLEQCNAADILRSSVHINLAKGETASVDELIGGVKKGYGFDIAGAMIGFIKKDRISKISSGDKIIALKSSGAHSNGYTDLRLALLNGDFEERKEYKKNYRGRFSLDSSFGSSTIGKILLEPTKIYTKIMAKISSKFNVVGVNNTGYGLKNFNRIKGFEFLINNPLKPQPIFELMQRESKFSDEKMYETLNMGMGFFIITNKDNADDILQIAKNAEIIGEVKKSDKTRTILSKNNKKIVFKGY